MQGATGSEATAISASLVDSRAFLPMAPRARFHPEWTKRLGASLLLSMFVFIVAALLAASQSERSFRSIQAYLDLPGRPAPSAHLKG